MTLFPKTRLFFSDLRGLIVRLIDASNNLAAVVSLNTATTAALLSSSQRIQAAVEYLKAAEQHRRNQAGLREEF